MYRFQPLSATNTNSLFYRTNDEKTVGKLSVTHNGVFWSAFGGLFYGGFGTLFVTLPFTVNFTKWAILTCKYSFKLSPTVFNFLPTVFNISQTILTPVFAILNESRSLQFPLETE